MSILGNGLAFVSGALAMWSLTPRQRSGRVKLNKNGHLAFPIDTLAEMLAIPLERRERFIAELPSMFRRMWELLDKFPLAPMRGSAWVDDELGEFRSHVPNAPDSLGDAFADRKLEPDGAK